MPRGQRRPRRPAAQLAALVRVDGASLWLTSVVKSQRWTDLERDPRVSVVIDAGHGYGELRGVELIGSVSPIGEVPRTAAPDPELETPERMFGDKYSGGTFTADGRHAWLRLTPDKIVSWDFRKLSTVAIPSAAS